MSDEPAATAGRAYPQAELARAFVTALTAADDATRERAEGRVERWRAVLTGMASGRLDIGSRAPVRDLPAWATLEVVHGGFATGRALAAGPLAPYELALGEHLGVGERDALFRAALTEPGLRELEEVLSRRTYRLVLAEEAVLLVVAWLVRAGDTAAAVRLVEEVAPFADRLRLLPPALSQVPVATSLAWRATAGQTLAALQTWRPHRRFETQREAVTVWAPFADEVLALWLETAEGGPVGAVTPPGWVARGASLLARYDDLAARHTLCTKHRRPKENLAILLAELRRAVAGEPAEPRRLGLLRAAVDGMLRRRGVPGSGELQQHREQQAAQVAAPTVRAVAGVVAARLAASTTAPGAADRGLDDPDAVLAPVAPGESALVPAGSEVPRQVERVVRRATVGTADQLVAAGVVPSAEVLAELVPNLIAEVVASAYEDADSDGALASLVAETYRAFQGRRGLLLLDLQRQVRFDDLPWVAAVAARRTGAADGDMDGGVAVATMRRLSALALEAFPATLLPNPFVAQLGVLARSVGADLPLVEELAADIFMGAFTPKFVRAAHVAAGLLQGTVYERYYGIGFEELAASVVPERPSRAADADGFAPLCHARAGVTPGTWSVAARGAVVEQAQILTTHNLAVLVAQLGVVPRSSWSALAGRCLSRVGTFLGRLDTSPPPLRTLKDAAYAWRQLVFFLALAPAQEQQRWRADADEVLATTPDGSSARLRLLLDGLDTALAGGTPERPFTGWVTGSHWLLSPSR